MKTEPPSCPLADSLSPAADQVSDDPLSDNVFMILDVLSSDQSQERVLVCSYSADNGLSYVGIPGDLVS